MQRPKIGGLDFGNKPITINCLEMGIVDHHWGSLTYDLWGEIGKVAQTKDEEN